MKFNHAAIWIDHQRAHVVCFNDEESQSSEIHAHGGDKHLHHKRGTIGSGHAPENTHYYDAVARAIAGIAAVLVMGPASAKHAFVKHVEAHHHELRKSIASVENADHPTDGEILAHARRWALVRSV